MALIGFDKPSAEVEPSLKPLTTEQMERLAELDKQLRAAPEPAIKAHFQEERRCRLLRWLRAENFNVRLVFNKMMDHAKWWKAYGMDEFLPEDENDETGPFFVCGEDRWGRPTAIARPAAHHAKTHEESMNAARRVIFTLQRLVERMPSSLEQFVIIYDAKGLTRNNLDITFAKELIPLIEKNFPGRLHRVVVINEHWGLSFFWAAISVLLPACVKAKITFAGSKVQEALGELVTESHPYLRYAIDVKQAPRAIIPLPASSPYVARCYPGPEVSSEQLKFDLRPRVSVDQDEAESVESTVCQDEVTSVGSTVGLDKLESDESTEAESTESIVDSAKDWDDEAIFYDCIEEYDGDTLPISPKCIPPARSNLSLFLSCSCCVMR